MFWKLFLGQLSLLAAIAVGVLLFGLPAWHRQQITIQQDSLQSLLESTARQLSQSPSSTDELIRALPSILRPTRDEIHFFSPTGVCLDATAATPPFPEVQSLLQTEKPAAKAPSEIGQPGSASHALRGAVRFGSEQSPAGIVSITRSLASINQAEAENRSRWIWILLAISAGLTAVTWGLTRHWSARLTGIEKEMASLAGDASSRPAPSLAMPGDEWHRLGRLVRDVQSAVRERVEGVEQVRKDLQTMLESIPEAVLAIDAEQRVLFANASTYRLFGLPLNDIAGQKLWAILRQPGLQDAVSMTLARKEPTGTEFAIRRPPRVVRYFGRSLTVGSGRGIIIVLHDITELRRLERLRQDFFASVSHELKTPLAAIKAYTETLLDDDQQDRSVTRRFLLRVEEQADRLHSLVIDMLMLARVESEDHGFDIKPIDARPAIVNSVDYFREKAQTKQVAIESTLLPDPCIVMADSEGLGMIIRNLVDNAVKYTPAGGRVSVTTSIDNGDLVVAVADTGVGIPVDDLNRIFERFYRVDKARSRELGGTGLGLSIVKHLVQRFGGAVSVKSRLNEGSTFTVSLPLAMGRSPSKLGQGLVEQEANA